MHMYIHANKAAKLNFLLPHAPNLNHLLMMTCMVYEASKLLRNSGKQLPS